MGGGGEDRGGLWSGLNESEVNLFTDSLGLPFSSLIAISWRFLGAEASLATIVLIFRHCKGSALTRDLFEDLISVD